MNPIHRKIQSALAVVQDYFFDSQHGLQTSQVIEVSGLDIDDQEKQHAVRYKPTRVRYFKELLRKGNLPREGVFVDVGCGMGRVLLMAAQYGFQRCVGIELSPSLANIAEQNVVSYSKRHPNLCPIEVHCANILSYQLKPEESIYHLFWPFDRVVTIQFLEQLRTSLRTSPRDCWLVINEFQFHDLLEIDPWFQRVQRIVYGAAEFDIYWVREQDIQAST